jgi:CubicO group peptidase (beta-lactamase class C family)
MERFPSSQNVVDAGGPDVELRPRFVVFKPFSMTEMVRNRSTVHGQSWLKLLILLVALLGATASGSVAQFDPGSFTRYAEAARDSFGVPGMAIAVVHEGRVVYTEGFGVLHAEEGGSVDEHTLFAIASNTKGFLATLLAQLVDEGVIDWDDRVRDHLPGFAVYDAYASHDMRVRDLLSHRSGLGTFSGDLIWYGTDYSVEEVLERVQFVPQTSPFRARYGYSNLMYLAAGELLSSVTDQQWDERVRSAIFDRIGMVRSVTSTRDLAGIDNVATPHKMHRYGEALPLSWYNWDAAGAMGGIISSVSDMARWMALHLNRGEWDGDTLFSLEASHEMWSPQTVIPISLSQQKFMPEVHFQAYGLGFSLFDYRGRKVVTHGGGYDGMFSRVAMVPEEELGVVILTNGMTSVQTALTYRVLDLFTGGAGRDWAAEYLGRARKARQNSEAKRRERDAARVAGTSPSKPLENYAGTYGGPMYGDARVRLEDGALVLELLPNEDLVADLAHWHYDTFHVEWREEFAWFDDGWIQFLLDLDGRVVEMKMDVPNEDFWFEELELRRRE